MTRLSGQQGSKQFSLRVAPALFEDLERRAREAAESRNALVERYIAEGVKMDEHPQICFRDSALGRRAALVGTRLDVWQIIDTIRNHENSLEDAAAYLGIPMAKVRGALRYYAAYREEIDEIGAREHAAADRAEAAWRAEQEILAG